MGRGYKWACEAWEESLFNNKDKSSRFLNYLNNRHSNIKCTMELEERDSNFRCPHQTLSKYLLSTEHRKKTFTPRKYKINLIRTLTALSPICSTFSSFWASLSNLKKTLLLNGYPKGILSYNMNDVINKRRNSPSKTVTTVPKKDVIFVFAWAQLGNMII